MGSAAAFLVGTVFALGREPTVLVLVQALLAGMGPAWLADRSHGKVRCGLASVRTHRQGSQQAGLPPAALIRAPSAFMPCVHLLGQSDLGGRGEWQTKVSASSPAYGGAGGHGAPRHLCGQATWCAAQGKERAWHWGRATELGEQVGQKWEERTGPQLPGTPTGGRTARSSAPAVGTAWVFVS